MSRHIHARTQVSASGHRERDSGLASIELVILLPAFVLLVLLATYLGRTDLAQSAVDGAAQDAARAASLQRNLADAQAAALQAAQGTLDTTNAGGQSTGSPCEPNTTTITITNATLAYDPFAVPVGTPSKVDILVSCKVFLADLIFPGLPVQSEVTISSAFTSPIDTYRLRTDGSGPAP